MNRHCTGDEIRALLQKLRARIPGLVLRTSLITGLPGEGEAEFEELCTWLREVRLERVGVFPFSPEEGTPAAVMTDRCEPDEAQRRADLILELQAGIMDDYNAACIGRDMTVLCEHRPSEHRRYLYPSLCSISVTEGSSLCSSSGSPRYWVNGAFPTAVPPKTWSVEIC